jgi:hypothetical protein
VAAGTAPGIVFVKFERSKAVYTLTTGRYHFSASR